uniref:Uncharacterized protein n=1 Tax=Vespula pensylvanica TaxID=30213 RepID=A0A834KV83_VESPE|nr:hypothetical protein H0235_012691 [Vespula pensylvanica]
MVMVVVMALLPMLATTFAAASVVSNVEDGCYGDVDGGVSVSSGSGGDGGGGGGGDSGGGGGGGGGAAGGGGSETKKKWVVVGDGKNVKAPARTALRREQYAPMNAYYIYL